VQGLPSQHQHALIQGIETARSAYYPVRMVESIVRHWKNQLAPQRHVQALTSPDVVAHSQHAEHDVKWTQRLQALPAEEVLPPAPDDGDLSDGYEPSILEAPKHNVSEKDRQAWHAKLQHYHRAAGHPTNKSLIHLFRDAGLPKWKIEMDRDLQCDACDHLLQGSKSSGEVPRATTHPLCKAWEIVGADSSEWHVADQKIKIKCGIITLLSGPKALKGEVCPLSLLPWRTWKLRRKALGSNDPEVQAVLDVKIGFFAHTPPWCEINGAGLARPRDANKVEFAEEMAKLVEGILCTDSKGGFDNVLYNESPLLGLSNSRSALQALQLREYLQRAGSKLPWVASDYDLGDSLTKKRADCRVGLQKFLKAWLWAVRYDPTRTREKAKPP